MIRKQILRITTIAAFVAILLAWAPSAAFAAPASTTTTSEIVPINLVQFVPCADGGSGEVINLTGTLHVVISVTTNDNGITLVSHVNPQGLSGEGLTTGDSYQGVGVTRTTLHIDSATTITDINNFRMIGQGPGNNLQIHSVNHITINPDGTTTSNVFISSVECL